MDEMIVMSIGGDSVTDVFMVLLGSNLLFEQALLKIMFNIFDRFKCWEQTVESFISKEDLEYKNACIDHCYY